MKTSELIAKQILKSLMKQDFAEWYGLDTSEATNTGGRFEAYLQGPRDSESPQLTDEEILQDIIQMFNLKKFD